LPRPYNAATCTIVSTLGVLLGISSICHGLPEILQGNRATPGLIVKALGAGYPWTVWKQGSEPAFTLVPNFLLTGILATVVGLLMILCSSRLMRRPYGPTVFLLLSIASFLVGGGLAQVLLFTLNWAVATRIYAPLGFWRWLIPRPARRVLGRFWRWPLVAGSVFFLAALEIAVFGYLPGVPGRREVLDRILWQLAGAIIVSFLASFLFGLAHDVQAGDSGA
jgi:hypothetical protein